MPHFWYSNATDLKCWFWINLLVSVRFRIRLVWFTMCHYLRLWHFHAFTALTCIYSDHTVSLQCHYVWSLDELKELSKMFQLCLASESYLLKIPCVDEWKAQQWTPWDSKTNPNSRPLMTREIPLCGTTVPDASSIEAAWTSFQDPPTVPPEGGLRFRRDKKRHVHAYDYAMFPINGNEKELHTFTPSTSKL